jgi:hypothetical protein
MSGQTVDGTVYVTVERPEGPGGDLLPLVSEEDVF